MAEYASLRPSDAREGGGLLDDADVMWEEARFVLWDYNGSIPQKVPAIRVKMNVEGEEGDGVVQYWSVGSATDWMPDESGKRLMAVGKATQLVNSTNGVMLLTSLINAGMDEEKMGSDISELDGLKCHMIRVPAPKRAGLSGSGGVRADGKTFEKTVLVVSKIHKMPWEKEKAGGKAAKGKASGKAAKSSEEGGAGEVDMEKAKSTLLEILLEAGDDGIAKSKMLMKAFQILKDEKDKVKLVQVMSGDEFLGMKEGWEYEGGVLKMV